MEEMRFSVSNAAATAHILYQPKVAQGAFVSKPSYAGVSYLGKLGQMEPIT